MSHNALIKALYRTLFRQINKTKHLTPIVDTTANQNDIIQNELLKASQNTTLYRRFLWTEIMYYITEEIRHKNPNQTSVGLYMKLSKADSLVQTLLELLHDPLNHRPWHNTINILVEHRRQQFEKSQWKHTYQENKQTIDANRNRNKPSLVLRRLATRKRNLENPRVDFSSLPANEKYKKYRQELAKSAENSDWVFKLYLKTLQTRGVIPNPYKLPYVSDNLTKQSLYLPNPEKLMPGSARDSVINEAYDANYIEAVVKPEIEHVINKNHFLDAYDYQVNEKGPWKVKIRTTAAGIMKARFLSLPYIRKARLKELALDIKRLTRLFKIQSVWDIDPKNKMHERPVDNGFAVRGSKGYSDEEVMNSRNYYQQLAEAEADWEFLMMKMELAKENLELEQDQHKLKEIHKSLRREWTVALDEVSDYYKNELGRLFHKYSNRSKIMEERARAQTEMDAEYQRRAEAYSNLVDLLKRDGVYLHSDLVNFNHPVTRGYDYELEKQMKRRVKNRPGLPSEERLGLGKRLGDYLAEHGLKSYKWGFEFKRRLKI